MIFKQCCGEQRKEIRSGSEPATGQVTSGPVARAKELGFYSRHCGRPSEGTAKEWPEKTGFKAPSFCWLVNCRGKGGIQETS